MESETCHFRGGLAFYYSLNVGFFFLLALELSNKGAFMLILYQAVGYLARED